MSDEASTGPRILIVDDDAALLRVIVDMLRYKAETWRIESETSADSALERITAVDYDVIVTDVQMPGTDGLTLRERVRHLRPNTPTVLVTGHGQHEVAVRALRAGAFDYIEKPIDFDYFLAAIARAVRLREATRFLDERQARLEKERTELARIVEEQTKELREANRVKDEFLAVLSHELRTPLTSILGWARLMLRSKLEPALERQAIEAIERNASLQARLIEDLLDVSRIMTGKLRLSLQPVAAASVADAALDVVRETARDKGLVLERAISAPDALVSADPDRLQQIVVNLLSNAIKFTPDGGRVSLRVEGVGDRVVITVADTGAGIDSEFLPYVFDRFRQGDTSLVRSRGGLGIGLSIARHLVELHSGSIHAYSSGPNRGASFTVALPLLDGAVVRADAGARARAAPAIGEPKLAGVRVLVVEDEKDARRFIATALERCGATVASVASAAAASEALDQALFDVLLCDIAMPHEDGYSLIRRVRNRERDGSVRIPAAALTAYARPEDARLAVAAGFDLHIPKPVAPLDLAKAVARLVVRERTERTRADRSHAPTA